MTFEKLTQILLNTTLFTRAECRNIIATCGRATIGHAIVACEILNFDLSGNDIDIMIETSII